MRYGSIPESPLEEQLVAAAQAPRALFDTFLPLVQARAIMAGLRLGVFEALRENAQTCAELARSLELDPEALELVLRMLTGAGYLVRGGDRYALSEVARRTLLADAAARVTAWVGMHKNAWDWLRAPTMSSGAGTGSTFTGSLMMPMTGSPTSRQCWRWLASSHPSSLLSCRSSRMRGRCSTSPARTGCSAP
jgi:hypothetical protein